MADRRISSFIRPFIVSPTVKPPRTESEVVGMQTPEATRVPPGQTLERAESTA
jgi:hypothetical protein